MARFDGDSESTFFTLTSQLMRDQTTKNIKEMPTDVSNNFSY